MSKGIVGLSVLLSLYIVFCRAELLSWFMQCTVFREEVKGRTGSTSAQMLHNYDFLKFIDL